MKNLIQNYENEILMAKDAVNRFKENPISFQVAQARLSTYERVVSDLKRNKLDNESIDLLTKLLNNHTKYAVELMRLVGDGSQEEHDLLTEIKLVDKIKSVLF